MLALSSEEIEVLGITIVCGNAPVQMGFENAKKVLKHLDRLDVPVYLGACDPLKKVYVNALIHMELTAWGKVFCLRLKVMSRRKAHWLFCQGHCMNRTVQSLLWDL